CAAQPAASFGDEDTARVDAVLRLIQERLDVAPEVAQTKWNSKAPIQDAPREQQIIDRVRGKAKDYGLEEQYVADFFQAQIEASKIMQRSEEHTSELQSRGH